jgi:hypothetical protein
MICCPLPCLHLAPSAHRSERPAIGFLLTARFLVACLSLITGAVPIGSPVARPLPAPALVPFFLEPIFPHQAVQCRFFSCRFVQLAPDSAYFSRRHPSRLSSAAAGSSRFLRLGAAPNFGLSLSESLFRFRVQLSPASSSVNRPVPLARFSRSAPRLDPLAVLQFSLSLRGVVV